VPEAQATSGLRAGAAPAAQEVLSPEAAAAEPPRERSEPRERGVPPETPAVWVEGVIRLALGQQRIDGALDDEALLAVRLERETPQAPSSDRAPRGVGSAHDCSQGPRGCPPYSV
jgi:hypothetical protein